jgi:hypothetical protein
MSNPATATTVDLTKLRAPFPPEYVGKLPRVTCRACSEGRCGDHQKSKCDECGNYISTRHIHLDYVGHADVTIRLLEVDPEWSWAPKATDVDPDLLKVAMASGDAEIVRAVIENAPPKFETDRNGSPVGLWIKLTVGGVTRLGVGSCPSNQNDAEKVLIGDALRNAAMRFGVAVDLWAKGDRADPTAENATASAGQASRRSSAQSAADAFETAAPAQPRQNGNGQQRGQVSRPAQPQAPEPADASAEADVDKDAQAFADEAHGATTLSEMEDIHRRAREAGKVTALVRNPASDGTGKPGKLAVYLDWKRKQVKEADDALAEFQAAAGARDMDVTAMEEHLRLVTGADLETANAAQFRQATQALHKTAAAA